MYNDVVSYAIGLSIELLVILLIASLTMVSIKAKNYLNTHTQLKNNVLAQQLVEAFIVHAEKELLGASGIQKRDYVLEMVVEVLGKKGIIVDTQELLASIERGVNATKTK